MHFESSTSGGGLCSDGEDTMERCGQTTWVSVAILFHLVAAFGPAGHVLAAERGAFGPTEYRVTAGSGAAVADSIGVPPTLVVPFRLHVQNGNPDGTNRVSAATITLNGVQAVGPGDLPPQAAELDRGVRLQTNNTLEVQVGGDPGGFLLVTLYGSIPTLALTALEPPALPIAPGATGLLTAALSAVSAEETSIGLETSDPTVAAVPPSATVPAGQRQVRVPVSGLAPGVATITATLNGQSVHSAISIVAADPTVTGLIPASLAIVQGASGIVTVTISAAQATDTTVALSSSDPRIVGLPPAGTVTVPAGQLAEPFAIFGGSPGTATITATLNGTTAQTQVTVVTALPAVVSLLPPVLPLSEGSTGTLTVTLSASQPTDTDVFLTTSDASVAGLPGDRVTVPAHTLSTSVPVTGRARGTATVTAALNGTAATAAITVKPPPPTLTGLTCPATLTEAATGLCTLTLNATQITDTFVPLGASDPGVLSVAPSVTVPAHTLTATVAVTAMGLGTATITAGPLHGTSQTANAQVLPPPPTIVSLLPSPASLSTGAHTALTLTLNAAQLAETVVPLVSTPAGVVQVPNSVTVAAGSLTGSVTITGMAPGRATVSAGPLNGSQAQTEITVTPVPPGVTALTPPTLALPQGTAEPLTVTIAPAQPDATPVPLASSDPTTVEVPPHVPVPAGDTSAAFPVIGRAPGTATVTAGPLHGPGRQATVTVQPADPGTLAIAPAAPILPPGDSQQFTATGTSADGASHDLTGAVAWATSMPTVAAISATGLATALSDGTATITATHPDGRTASATLTVSRSGLRVTGFRPQSGQVGDSVTVTGANFVGVAGVTFNGVPASAATVGSATTLTAVVPAGATTGPIAVTTPSGTATSHGHFVVLPTEDLRLTAAPTQPATVAGGEVHVALATTGGREAASLVSLGLSGLPPGASARFVPPALGPNQHGTLSIQTSATTAAGVYPLVLTGSTLTRGRTVGTQQALTLTVLAGGQTALTGRILDTHRRPIPGVTIQMPVGSSTLEAVTDAAGNFLLQNVPPGTQLVLVDGQPASHATAKYPTIPITVTIQPGVVNRLPFTPHLHAQKDRDFTPIHRGQDTVATDPELPGAALRIPRGAQILGWDGQPNTRVSIRTVPIDRLPVPPLPPEVRSRTVYMFYFGKRGGGVASQPIPFDAPNDLGLRPGQKADLWYFDESPLPGGAPNAWRKVGTGTVSADGRLIRSDPGVGIPKFCCGAAAYNGDRDGQKVPQDTSQEDQEVPAGDPVDLSTGVFMLKATDLVLPGRIPVALTRSYRSGDTVPGPFGLGTTLGYDDFLEATSPDLFTYVYRANAHAPFARQPDGTFINTTVPAFRGARITVNPDSTRTLRFKEGSALVFQSNGQLIRKRDRVGNEVVIERAMQSNTSAIREPSGRALEFTWEGVVGDHILSVRDPLGRSVQYEYDGSNRLVAVTNPAGGVTRYSYDAQHRMTSITDPRGIVFLQNSYDVNSRVCQQQQADGGWFRFFYITADQATLPESQQLLNEAAAGGPISQAPCTGAASSAIVTATVLVDPRGKPTTYRFNGQSYLLQVTDALGQVTTYERQEGTNLLLSVTDPLNRVTRFQYDANGNVTQLTDALDKVRTFTYDSTYNKVTSMVDPLGNLTTFEYDAQGNLTAITDPEQNLKPEPERLKTRMTYNQYGQVLTATDPLGNVTQLAYTPQGDLASVTDPLGNTTQRSYDAVSRLRTQVDPLGRVTQFGYDPLNRLVALVDARGGPTTFSYDPNGNLLTVSDARGSTTTHEYDPMNRPSRRIDPLGKAETFSYDGNENLTSTTDRKNQTTSFTYDALNRRTQVSYADSAVATFSYDAVGRLTQADDTADPHRPIAFTYDPLDRLLTETTTLGTVSYTYDTAGRRTSMTVSGQSPVNYTYDHNARLRTITQTPLNPVDIQYDAAGWRTLLTLPNGVSTEYLYDLGSRLTTLIYRNALGLLGDLTYQYDPAGNRTAVGGSFARTLVPDAVANSTYDAGNRQLAFGANTMTFDDNGNLLTQTDPSGTITYTWDARNRLTVLSGPNVNGSFAYDGLGRRARKTISSVTTDFVYDGLDIVKETGGAGDASYLRTLAIDEALTRTDSVDTVHYLANALGSTMALTNPAGSSATTYTYDPFGRTAIDGVAINPVQYTGRENDGAGLYYYRARFYQPALGRFLSQDPIGLRTGDVNLFSYTDNSPVSFKDPLGLCPMCAAAPAAPAIGAAAVKAAAVISGLISGIAIGDWLWHKASSEGPADAYPEPASPPDHWIPDPTGKPDTWKDPTTGEWWHWHPDPTGSEGGDHWDIGGPRGPNGEKGKQDWWPRGGDRGPKPPGEKRPKGPKKPVGHQSPGATPLGCRKC
jgi:RHS repeat-associated protein